MKNKEQTTHEVIEEWCGYKKNEKRHAIIFAVVLSIGTAIAAGLLINIFTNL